MGVVWTWITPGDGFRIPNLLPGRSHLDSTLLSLWGQCYLQFGRCDPLAHIQEDRLVSLWRKGLFVVSMPSLNMKIPKYRHLGISYISSSKFICQLFFTGPPELRYAGEQGCCWGTSAGSRNGSDRSSVKVSKDFYQKSQNNKCGSTWAYLFHGGARVYPSVSARFERKAK